MFDWGLNAPLNVPFSSQLHKNFNRNILKLLLNRKFMFCYQVSQQQVGVKCKKQQNI